MWDDPDAARARQQRREEARRRRQESQREDLFHAARILIADRGIAVPLSAIAVRAGLPRHVAAGLFNGTTDLAVTLVRRAWHALIETTAPRPGATPHAFIAGLIRAIAADAVAHGIHQELRYSAALSQRAALAEDEAFLAAALAEGLRETWPALGAPDAARRAGRRLLGLCRDAALQDPAADAKAEAAIIADMIAASLQHPLPAAAALAPAAGPRPPRAAAAPAPRAATPRPAMPPQHWPRPLAAAAARAAAPVHDPPAQAA